MREARQEAAMTAHRAFAPIDLLMLLAIALIWGVNNILAKIAVDALPAMMMVACRFGVVLIALALFIKPLPQGRRVLFFTMLAFIGPIHFGLQSVGLKLATDFSFLPTSKPVWPPMPASISSKR